jgi:hypothetical protein
LKTWRSFKKWWNMFSGMIRSALGDPDAWGSSIRHFEAEDRISIPSVGSILFVGSSTFTLWATLEKDMSPLRVINRGFGGAKISDVTRHIERIVVPYRPKAIVLFAGTNDVAGRKPATADEVCKGNLMFVNRVKDSLPKAQIYYLAISPTPLR